MNLQTSLYDIYEKNYDLKLTQVDQMLSVLPNLNPNILNLFELNENTPSFLLTGATFCGKGTILEMEESIFRGDKYSFSVKAT
jgi:GntR family transcriptional regulator